MNRDKSNCRYKAGTPYLPIGIVNPFGGARPIAYGGERRRGN